MIEPAERTLAQRLVAAGKVLGCTVTVTDGDAWEETPDGVSVGLGFFLERGYTADDAVALSIRDLWVSIQLSRRAPGRAFRRASIAAARPELAPLLAAIERVQAEQELCVAMPGLAPQLRAATLRGVPAELRELPLETQWVGAILRLCAGAEPGAVDDPVVEELGRLLASGAQSAPERHGAALARVMLADRSHTPVERLDRALALLAPPMLRLRGRGGRGLTGESGAGEEGDDLGAAPEIDLGDGAGAGEASTEGDPGAAAESAAVAPEADPNTEPDVSSERGAPASQPEPDSLTEVQGSDAPESLLDIPLPVARPRPLRDLAAAVGSDNARARPEGAPESWPEDLDRGRSAAALGGAAAAQLAEYRGRTGRYAPEIRRLRELWREVLTRNRRERQVLSRRATPEGEQLHAERLAETVAEVRAGVRMPAAFRSRVSRARDADALGEIDYLLVLDRSASMQGGAAEACADAALVMLESLAAVSRDIRREEARSATRSGIALRAGAIVFADHPIVVAPLGRVVAETTRAALTSAVRAAGGQTDAAAALEAAGVVLGIDGELGGLVRPRSGLASGAASGSGRPRTAARGSAPARRRIVLFVGDGDADDPVRLAAAVARLRERGVEVHGIGIGAAEGVSVFAPDSHRIGSVRELPAALAGRLATTLPGARRRVGP